MAEKASLHSPPQSRTQREASPPPVIPFQHEIRLVCPTCRDLSHDLFEGMPDDDYEDEPDMRYHITNFAAIHASAQRGCTLCSILYRGMNLFWKGPWKGVARDSKGEDENEKAVDDTQEGTLPHYIFLRLRPGKPLLLFRKSYISNGGKPHFKGIHTELEFFTESSMNPSTHATTLDTDLPPLCHPITHPAFGHAPKLPPHLTLPHCISLLTTWLQTCDTSHPHCHTPLSTLPKRLVLVSEPFKLIETTGLLYSKYATLSHCWGKGPSLLKTTTQNYTNRLTGIDWDEFPPVFQDAISIAREIGCKWIWIDSLCIVQDSSLDWKEESKKMADIYSNSYLNIAATFSPTSHGNFFSDRERVCLADDWDASESEKGEWTMEALELPDETNAGLAVRVSHTQGHGYIRTDRIWGRNYAAPLLDRAWVFQERLLSPRTLHFEASEMIWECNASLMCECGGLSGTKNLKEGLKIKFADACQDRMSREEITDLWQRIVRVYSSLKLTNVSDRPYAHAGIASRIHGKLKSEYLAGMWAADLPRGLLWDSVGPYEAKRLEGCGPTWSWLPFYPVPKNSLACVLYRGDMTTFVQDDRLRIHHEGTFCEYVDGNPFGSVSFGQLDITAAASDGIIQVDMSLDSKRYDHRIVMEGIRSTRFNPDCAFSDELWSDTKVLCLYIGLIESEIRVLVLKRHMSGDYYTRVGVAKFPLVNYSSFNSAKVMRVKIL